MDNGCRTAQGGSVEARLWGDLLGGIFHLSRLYQQQDDGRRFLRCESVLKTLESLLKGHGAGRDLPVAELLRGARALEPESGGRGGEFDEPARWWACTHASFQLASLYGLGGQEPDLALRLADVHREIRSAVQCVYPDTAGKAMIRAATTHPDAQEDAFRDWVRRHLVEASRASLMEDAG